MLALPCSLPPCGGGGRVGEGGVGASVGKVGADTPTRLGLQPSPPSPQGGGEARSPNRGLVPPQNADDLTALAHGGPESTDHSLTLLWTVGGPSRSLTEARPTHMS